MGQTALSTGRARVSCTFFLTQYTRGNNKLHHELAVRPLDFAPLLKISKEEEAATNVRVANFEGTDLQISVHTPKLVDV